MSSLVFSIPTTPANASTGTASSSARGQGAQSPTDSEGFGAALARMRDARARQPEDKADPAADVPATRRRTPAAAQQREDASPAELLAMAMLTPAFGAQAVLPQGRATAQGGEADAGADRGVATAAGAEDPLAGTDASAAMADARAASQAGNPAATAAAQSAQAAKSVQAQADEQQDKDAKSAKAKAETITAAPDAKAPVAAMPAAAVPQPPAAAAAATTAATGATSTATAAASASRATADAAALPLQASGEAAPAEQSLDTPSDTPALLPGALSFKTALAEAANASGAAQAQAVPRYTVPTPVGSEGWGPDIGTQMIRMGADGHHVAELSLNPAGLGPLKVTLTLGDNQAQAMFVSAHESVRRAVEAALPQLRDTLAGQGIQLGQASVDAGTQQHQAFNQDRQERGFETSARPAARDARHADIESEPARPAVRSRSGNGIDTFA